MSDMYDIDQCIWPHSNNSDSFFMDDDEYRYAFSPPFFATDASLEISSTMQQYLGSIFSDECMEFPRLVEEVHEDYSREDLQIDFDEFDHIFEDDMDHDRAMDVPHASMQISQLLEEEEIDSEGCLLHLLVAYAEAIDKQETLLSGVIVEHMIKKVNPVGGIVDRIMYYMFRHLYKESDYLVKECLSNFYAAFKAFYQILPYGRFAHLVANSAIIENMPSHVDIIHVFDFDIGEGIQISFLLEEMKDHRCKEVRVISVRLGEDGEFFSHSIWNFEETKIRICNEARSCGIDMTVEEVGFMDLGCKMKNIEKECYGRKSWHIFNCMVGLPHMGRIRSKKCVLKFLQVAKDFLQNVRNCETGFSKGIITYGDGDTWCGNMTNCVDYTTFLDSNVRRFRAFLESLEFSFPYRLGEARVALESLFVAPYFSSITLERKWEENKQCGGVDQLVESLGMEGLRLSEKCMLEASEMVREGDDNSPYGVRFMSEKKNEMGLHWRGTPLVRVSCWKR
ncbi:nodulation-signaling pathway 2 protein-like [Dorcoceras hygrometricum]|uniref:Nodulation-signaling pathway 2 protein-like n=1 Tax=Dorcoceras hygrometricum TaxID=472368 RepID=A0A2Z7A106_9LAMI|nr:nodulation-signaling pathway 2 protein-like [Dorcoceras hygrometricum]